MLESGSASIATIQPTLVGTFLTTTALFMKRSILVFRNGLEFPELGSREVGVLRNVSARCLLRLMILSQSGSRRCNHELTWMMIPKDSSIGSTSRPRYH